MNKHYRYIHILYHDELKFSRYLLDFFHDDETGIDNSEHYFVTPYKSVYEGLKEYDNIEYIPVKNAKSAEIVNKIGKYCDWIFMHNNCKTKSVINIKRKYAKKIIWRYWGGRALQKIPYGNNPVKNIAIWMVNKLVYKKVHLFKAIGVSNTVDNVEIERTFGELNYIRIPYPNKDVSELVLPTDCDCDDYYRIMIGHSGFEEDKHIKYVEELKRHCNKGLKIYMLLSYGDAEYIEKVKTYVTSCGVDVEIIDSYLHYNEFVSLLYKMDATVLDAKYSYALGNLRIYLMLRKKIFLNPEGVIAKAFDIEGVPYEKTINIKSMSFEELTKPIEYKDDPLKWFSIGDYISQTEAWKKILIKIR